MVVRYRTVVFVLFRKMFLPEGVPTRTPREKLEETRRKRQRIKTQTDGRWTLHSKSPPLEVRAGTTSRMTSSKK